MTTIDRNAAARAIDEFLRAIGRDPSAEEDLAGTGARVAAAFVDELCAGYAIDTRALVAAAAMPARSAIGSLVVVRDVPVVTTCPHHLMPASGSADVAIQAKASIVGIGAIAELVDAHARRLALQERIGEAVVEDLDAVLGPVWVACRLSLVHGCMIARGTRPTGARVETISRRNIDAGAAAAIFGRRGGAE